MLEVTIITAQKNEDKPKRDDLHPLYKNSFKQKVEECRNEALARCLLNAPIADVERYMKFLSESEREALCAALFDLWHKRCAKG